MKMANTKSIKKVLNYLKTKDNASSTSEICCNVMLKYKTVKDVIEILKMNNEIIILSTGKTTLIQLKKPTQKYEKTNNTKTEKED